MNRRRFLAKVVTLSGGLAAVEVLKSLNAAEPVDQLTKTRFGMDVPVCRGCAQSVRYSNCIQCGKPMHPTGKRPARMCLKCAWGKENKCAYCDGLITGKPEFTAFVCWSCYRENRCYKCGGYAGPDSDV